MNRLIPLFLFIAAIAGMNAENLSLDELIKNGDFSEGRSGFTSEYIFTNGILMHLERYYSIGDNPKKYFSNFAACKSHSAGDNLMMIINGSEADDVLVWGYDAEGLERQTDYMFSFWYASISPVAPPKLQVYINGANITPDTIFLSSDVCQWMQFRYEWNSGANLSARIEIYNRNVIDFGNDFILDDISLRAICYEEKFAGEDKSICYGETAELGMKPAIPDSDLEYRWSPSAGLSADNIPNPVFSGAETATFYLEVFEEPVNCYTYDTVTVYVSEGIDAKITADGPTTICPCDSVTLSAPPGYEYEWTTGSAEREITVGGAGIFGVTVTNSDGCGKYAEIEVFYVEGGISLEMGDKEAFIGDTVQFNIRANSTMIEHGCELTNYELAVRYRNSVLTPLFTGFEGYADGDYYVISLSGESFSEILKEMPFLVTLGDSTGTALQFDFFDMGCEEYAPELKNGSLKVNGICVTGYPRLVKSAGQLYLKEAYPNPAGESITIKFGLIEKGRVNITIRNNLGEIALVPLQGSLGKGEYEIEAPLAGLPQGVYYFTLSTLSQRITRSFRIIN